MRILVGEDDSKVAGFIRKGLEEEGHAVEVAGAGAAALERATDGTPWDLVVLDAMLPKGDGFHVLKEVRRQGLRMPVLMVTARDAALLEYFLRNAGRVLTRPMLAQHVWGLDFDPESNVVDVYVGYLRRRIEGSGERRRPRPVRGGGGGVKEGAR